MTEWRPIKTAPKDGTLLLLYDPNLTWTNYDTEDEHGISPTYPMPMFVGRWHKFELGGRWVLAHYDAFRFQPTLWQHLPIGPGR